MSCPEQPTCGSQGVTIEPTGGSVLSEIKALIGVVGTVSTIWGLAQQTALLTIFGVTAPVAIWGAAVAGALIAFGVVALFYYHRCAEQPDGLSACSAGVIERIVLGGTSSNDFYFPYTAMHDRVDVVVKCIYWPLVQTNAGFVVCNDDAQSSPMLYCFYKSAKVCAGALGATIGAGIGVIVGILVAVAVATAIGCATVFLCIAAIVVGFVVAVVVVLYFALMGGAIGQTFVASPEPTADGGNVLRVGDYVTTEGGLITSGDFEGARVYWFVKDTTLHGYSTGSRPFSHRDPDSNLLFDGCLELGPVPVP